jgi:hypothetical protein
MQVNACMSSLLRRPRTPLCHHRGVRIVVGLYAGQDPSPVVAALERCGARYVQPPAPSLPDVVVAEFPEGLVTMQQVAEIPGVRYAEPDQLRKAF